MSDKFQTPRGTFDILPDDHQYYSYIKKVARHRFRQAGFRRISTPVFEMTELFARGVGDSTDIVNKEMYTFQDRKGRSLTLKPEGTAGVVRAYLEHNMQNLPQPQLLYYIEPHFRYDRPQKGRFRQFHQFGIEAIGEQDPSIDAQVIYLAHKILEDLKIRKRFTLQINSIGSSDDRKAYREALLGYYIGKEHSLCEDCKARLQTNPLRLLDCKEEDCQILAKLAPKFEDYLSADSKKHYQEVKSFLDELEVKYVENPQLVRGLDYYTHTVFEFWDAHEGAQNAIGGGGRYDGLVELMGGKPTPAVGWACGMERVIAHMHEANSLVPIKDHLEVFVAQLGGDAKKKCLKLLCDLREAGIQSVGALGQASMKSQLKLADKFATPWAVIIGQIEVNEGIAIVRNMKNGVQEIIPYEEVVDYLLERIDEDEIDEADFLIE